MRGGCARDRRSRPLGRAIRGSASACVACGLGAVADLPAPQSERWHPGDQRCGPPAGTCGIVLGGSGSRSCGAAFGAARIAMRNGDQGALPRRVAGFAGHTGMRRVAPGLDGRSAPATESRVGRCPVLALTRPACRTSPGCNATRPAIAGRQRINGLELRVQLSATGQHRHHATKRVACDSRNVEAAPARRRGALRPSACLPATAGFRARPGSAWTACRSAAHRHRRR